MDEKSEGVAPAAVELLAQALAAECDDLEADDDEQAHTVPV
jgi:hypothetical protein